MEVYYIEVLIISKQVTSSDHQQQKGDRLTTNTSEPMEQNEIYYEEVGECSDSTFNVKHNISYATTIRSVQ